MGVAVHAHGGVSTHSRLKAAGNTCDPGFQSSSRFNTQPPEGGWFMAGKYSSNIGCFNTQPPEGGWIM